MSDTETTFCNARLRTGGHDPDELEKREPSDEWAGEGYCKRRTETPRCRNHGGGNTSHGRPPSHGLTSSLRDQLREFVTEAANMDNPGDLTGELAVLRGLLFRWLEGKNDPDKDDIEAAHKLLKEIRRTSDTIHKQMTRERLTKDEEQQLLNTFAGILRSYVPESDRDDALTELENAVGANGGVPPLENGQ